MTLPFYSDLQIEMYVRGPRKAKEGEAAIALPASAERRMAKLQKATARSVFDTLARTSTHQLDGIFASTWLGCLEDTELFLSEIQDTSGSLRSPLPFMRSTHNTMAGQIALLLKCTGPNITHSRALFGFHCAALDAMMHLEQQPEHTVLLFAADERTPLSDVLIRAADPERHIGEGVGSWVLGARSAPGDVARISIVHPGRSRESPLWPEFFQQLGTKGLDLILWSGYGPTLDELPGSIAMERYDTATGQHGAQSALALAMVLERFADGRLAGPALVFDQLNDQQAAILVEPC